MSFVRADARAAVWRWREVLVATGALGLGLYWVVGPGGLLAWVGWALILAGAALGVIGFQRVRFRTSEGGPGVVRVDEGQITYFGPLTGGAVAARDLERLTLDPTAQPAHWVLYQPGQPVLEIPVNASGSEALFDVFAGLPGIRTERMLAQLQGKAIHPVVIWERNSMRPEGQRLH